MRLMLFERVYSNFFAIAVNEPQLFYCSLLFIIYCLISQYDSSILLVNMWIGVDKSFCVLEYARTNSIILIQRHFRDRFYKNAPKDKTIKQWYETFENTGCFCVPKTRATRSIGRNSEPSA